MRKEDSAFAKTLAKRLKSFEAKVHPLPGIQDEEAKNTLIFQMIESIRRTRFVKQVAQRPISPSRKDPASEFFDPIRAAIVYRQKGEIDEAGWLVFLFVHFGKNAKSGYRLIADVYGRLGSGKRWTWKSVVADPLAFRQWLHDNQENLKTLDGVHRGFGNHRKYQSLHAWKSVGSGEAVQSYVSWVTSAGGHSKLFAGPDALGTIDPETLFSVLFKDMAAVRSFGRTARFDYLAMLGKLELALIAPDSVHFDGATGPLTGANLLFTGKVSSKGSRASLEALSDALATHLQVDKQVVEDSLCNWQKDPTTAIRFRG